MSEQKETGLNAARNVLEAAWPQSCSAHTPLLPRRCFGVRVEGRGSSPPATGTWAPTTPPEETWGGWSSTAPAVPPWGFCGIAASGAVPPAHASPTSSQLTSKYTDYFRKKNRFFFISKSPCSARQNTASPAQGAPPQHPRGAQRWKGRRTFFRLLCLASPLGAPPSVLGGAPAAAAAPGGAAGGGGDGKPPGIGPEVPWNTRVKKSCRSAAELGLPLEALLLTGRQRLGGLLGGAKRPQPPQVPPLHPPAAARARCLPLLPPVPILPPALTSAAHPRRRSVPRRRCGRGRGGCRGRSPRAGSRPTLRGDTRRHWGLALTPPRGRGMWRRHPPVMS